MSRRSRGQWRASSPEEDRGRPYDRPYRRASRGPSPTNEHRSDYERRSGSTDYRRRQHERSNGSSYSSYRASSRGPSPSDERWRDYERRYELNDSRYRSASSSRDDRRDYERPYEPPRSYRSVSSTVTSSRDDRREYERPYEPPRSYRRASSTVPRDYERPYCEQSDPRSCRPSSSPVPSSRDDRSRYNERRYEPSDARSHPAGSTVSTFREQPDRYGVKTLTEQQGVDLGGMMKNINNSLGAGDSLNYSLGAGDSLNNCLGAGDSKDSAGSKVPPTKVSAPNWREQGVADWAKPVGDSKEPLKENVLHKLKTDNDLNLSPFGDNEANKEPFDIFKGKVLAGPILRSHLSNTVNNNEHDAPTTICIDDDDDNSNDAYLDDKNDKDFNPESIKKTGTKKNPLSLGTGNVRKSGRKKGGKNIQPPKQSFKDELKKTKLELEKLTGALKPAESEKLKPGPLIQTFKKAKKVPTKEDIIRQLSSSAIEARFIDQIYDGCLMTKPAVTWDDIGGLEPMKISMKEMIIDPLKRPDIFRGLRAAPKGVLLYGPPGTGKTMIARCIASQCDSSFLNVSASKLTSKWVGDGEKAVQALFAVARAMQPSIIFIDEVDSMLSKRTEKENESSKKMKTEFLVQMDGAASQEADNVLVIGATNRPDDLDEAIRRRFQKRFMIPLPDNQGRIQILKAVLAHEKKNLEEADYCTLANALEGYSGADIRKVCSEASMTPVREWSGFIETVEESEIRAIDLYDLMKAAECVKPSVSLKDLSHYEDFHKLYGDKP